MSLIDLKFCIKVAKQIKLCNNGIKFQVSFINCSGDFTMARYQIGNSVALINKFERCGKIVSIDEKGKGYKVDTGKDVVFFYERDMVLISDLKAPDIAATMIKIDKAVGKEVWFTPDIAATIKEFLTDDSGVARAFGDYIAKVHGDVLYACLKAIKDSGLELPKSVTFTLFHITLFKL